MFVIINSPIRKTRVNAHVDPGPVQATLTLWHQLALFGLGGQSSAVDKEHGMSAHNRRWHCEIGAALLRTALSRIINLHTSKILEFSLKKKFRGRIKLLNMKSFMVLSIIWKTANNFKSINEGHKSKLSYTNHIEYYNFKLLTKTI